MSAVAIEVGQAPELVIVEDDDGHFQLISRALRRTVPHVVTRLSSLGAAREHFRSREPQLALIDMHLSDGSGLELLTWHARTFPMVMMTGQGCEEVAVEAMKQGALDYLVKDDDFLNRLPLIVTRALREWNHIQERKEAEAALRRMTGRYRALYDETPAMFFTVDDHGALVSVNEFGATRMGYTVEELRGEPVETLCPPDDRERWSRQLRDVMEGTAGISTWETLKQCKDGSRFWARETARAVESDDGDLQVLMVCEDVTDAHELSQQLTYQATHDALTGLVNRREFELRLQRVLNDLGTSPGEHVLCFLDLDQFKVVNDTCGHSAGDELLCQIAESLRAKVRKRDTLARLGGDEFGLLMEHCSAEHGYRVASSLRETVESFRFAWENKTFVVGASIGLVPVTQSQTMTEVLSAADSACYTAKERGRNRVHVYHAGDEDLARKRGEMQWVPRLQRALEEDRFLLMKQAIVRTDAERNAPIERYEVLVRMVDESGDVVPPRAFLPAADRFDLTPQIDRWVVDHALAWLAEEAAEIESCSINISGSSMADSVFTDFVIERLAAHAIPPERVCFEITETAAIANLRNAVKLMHSLRRHGCQFALDDFGCGFSSFAYLKSLPVDYIKIDGSFVRDVVCDPVSLSMVRAIAEVGKAMGKSTVAEFVESPEILRVVHDIGIDFAQGYAIARPIPVSG